MGQITKAFAEQMLEHCKRGDHPPITVWEAEQLARAWLEREELREQALRAPGGYREGMLRAAEIVSTVRSVTPIDTPADTLVNHALDLVRAETAELDGESLNECPICGSTEPHRHQI